jgi:hypothetical protein
MKREFNLTESIYMVEAHCHMAFAYHIKENGGWRKVDTISELSPEQLEQYEGMYSHVQDDVLVAVREGRVYACPYTEEAEEALKEKGFITGGKYFTILLKNNTSELFLNQWESLLYRREHFEQQKVKAAIKAYCEEKGLGEINPELLTHCMRVPNRGFEIREEETDVLDVGCRSHGYIVTEEHNRLRVYPCRSYWLCGSLNFRTEVGSYRFRNGICLFAYSDGSTYFTPDYEVVLALEEAGYDYSALSCVPDPAHAVDPDIASAWNALKGKYMPERTFDCRRAYNLYPFKESNTPLDGLD